MSSNDYLTQLPPTKMVFSDQTKEAVSIERFNPNIETFHITSAPDQTNSPPTSPDICSHPCDPTDGSITLYHRRHFVIHSPSCRPAMKYNLCKGQPPAVTADSVGIPRAHIVLSIRDPAHYNIEALGSRSLSKGPLVAVGEYIFLLEVGKVLLGESCVVASPPFWKFFSAHTEKNAPIELATEWRFVRLTEEEYELCSSSQHTRRDRGTASVSGQLASFLELEEEGWLRGWAAWFRKWHARIITIFLHQVVDSAA